MEKPLAICKVVFLGDIKVGKTSILTRFMYKKFDYAYKATIGVEFLSRTMYLKDRTIRLQLWDSAGQERFRDQIPSYIRDSSVAVIVYDVTNRHSFLNTAKWIETVRTVLGSIVIIAFVGNKIDHADKREVSFEEGYAKAREHGAMFAETSAKEGSNVKALFLMICAVLPACALHTTLPPFHYGQTSSDIPTNSGTHVGRSEPDATTTPQTDDPHD